MIVGSQKDYRIALFASPVHRREWNQCEDCKSAFYSKILQSCNPAIIDVDCKVWKLDCGRIAKYKNIQFWLFRFCIDLYGWKPCLTHIISLIAALSCSASVLQPWTQSACNPPLLHENHLDCVWFQNPSQSWLQWIAPRFRRLRRDFDGLQAHNRLCNPKNCIAIH